MFGLPNVKDIMKMRDAGNKMKAQAEATSIVGYSKSKKIKVVIDGSRQLKDIEFVDTSLVNDKMLDLLKKEIMEAFIDAGSKWEKEMVKNINLDDIKGMLDNLK